MASSRRAWLCRSILEYWNCLLLTRAWKGIIINKKAEHYNELAAMGELQEQDSILEIQSGVQVIGK